MMIMGRERAVGRGATIVAGVGLLLMATADGARAANVINHWGTGAVAAFSTCQPEAGGTIVCHDQFVTYGVDGFTRSNQPPPGQSLAALSYEHYAARFYPDGAVDEFIAEFGFTTSTQGFFDAERLTSAWVSGGTIDLYDIDVDSGTLIPNGRVVTLGPFQWVAASQIYVFGNDGPGGFGLPRRYVDRCVTALDNAHERFTAARVTGTIDGISVATFGEAYLPWPGTGPADARGIIYNNRFNVIQETHGPGC